MKRTNKRILIPLAVAISVAMMAGLAVASGALPGFWPQPLSPLAPPKSISEPLPVGTPVALPKSQATTTPLPTATVPPPPGYPTDEPWPPPSPTPYTPEPTLARPPSLAPVGFPPDNQQVLYYVADNAGFPEFHAVGIDERGEKRSEFNLIPDLSLGRLVGLYPSPDGQYLAMEVAHDPEGISRSVVVIERSSGRAWCPFDQPERCWGSFWDWTPDNQMLFYPSGEQPGDIVRNFWLVDISTGKYQALDLPTHPRHGYSLVYNASISSDGSVLAYSITYAEKEEEISEIWTMRMDGGKQLVRRMQGVVNVRTLQFSPAGDQLIYVYQSEPGQFLPSELWLLNADGSGAKLLAADLAESGELCFRPAWSPDGRYVAFVQLDKPITFDGTYVILAWSNVYVVDTITGQVARLSAFEKREATYPAWSPDGRFVAFVSTGRLGEESLYSEVWVASTDGSQLYVVSETAKPYNALAWLPPLSSWKGEER
jgi:dipeptidyl aminopeptidase/acylaminoacyl peptidase